jgi:hypothetical protein
MGQAFAMVLATMALHLIGSAILFGIVSGPEAAIFSPILAVFGWFFIPLEAVVVAIQTALLSKPERRVFVVWLLTVPISVVFMSWVGPKEEGKVVLWTVAYCMATLIASTSALAIVAIAARYSSRSPILSDGG